MGLELPAYAIPIVAKDLAKGEGMTKKLKLQLKTSLMCQWSKKGEERYILSRKGRLRSQDARGKHKS